MKVCSRAPWHLGHLPAAIQSSAASLVRVKLWISNFSAPFGAVNPASAVPGTLYNKLAAAGQGHSCGGIPLKRRRL